VRQNREREKRVFAGFGAFLCPENKRSPKKKKDLRRIWSVFLSHKQALSKKRRIWSDFLSRKQAFSKKRSSPNLERFSVPKNGSGYRSLGGRGGGQKSPRRGQNISVGAAALPTSRSYGFKARAPQVHWRSQESAVKA